MNKKTIALISVLTLLAAGTTIAKANDVVFEPVASSNTYEYIQTPKAVQQPIASIPSYTVNTTQLAADTVTAVSGDNYQISITGLENEQVELRSKLQNFNNQYSEIEQRYQNVSLERKNMKKNIKETEKKIKSLERIKTKLQKEATVVQ